MEALRITLNPHTDYIDELEEELCKIAMQEKTVVIIDRFLSCERDTPFQLRTILGGTFNNQNVRKLLTNALYKNEGLEYEIQ